jgi:hypothetical protein
MPWARDLMARRGPCVLDPDSANIPKNGGPAAAAERRASSLATVRALARILLVQSMP